jgi:hypothetical protein
MPPIRSEVGDILRGHQKQATQKDAKEVCHEWLPKLIRRAGAAGELVTSMPDLNAEASLNAKGIPESAPRGMPLSGSVRVGPATAILLMTTAEARSTGGFDT